MSTTFPKVLTALRKERGVSQKQAAGDLGISQALLSHYEKGIRECGLDFVVKVADYYDVSCDYLLGRTPEKSGALLGAGLSEAVAESDGAVPAADRKMLFNTLSVILDLLERSHHAALSTCAFDYLSLALYVLFRLLYSANAKNVTARFAVPDYLFLAAAGGEADCCIAKMAQLCAGKAIDGSSGLSAASMPLLSAEKLQKDYPLFASSLLHLLRSAENRMNNVE